jgi:HK97 family phage portal protein
MTTLHAKPHITRAGGHTIVEYRVDNLKAASQLMPVYGARDSSFGLWDDTFTGAWQRNIIGTSSSSTSALRFSAVYACISLIAGDISKLRLRLMENRNDGTWQEVTDALVPFLAVLRKPNPYQTRVQFLTSWITSKLVFGNAYILKERDARNMVTAMHVLDPSNVTPLVAESGDVFYRLRRDNLAGVEEDEDGDIVPASEIIHDRMVTFWHPLVGVSPISACGLSAMQGGAIQANAQTFFENMSRPSGILIAPGKISQETADRLKTHWESNFSGTKIGRMAVVGDGLTYQALTIPASDAQLIEQLRWTVEDVARCFHVPVYKIGLPANMTLGNSGQYDQDYYAQCLQTQIEAVEVLHDEGLSLPSKYRTEFDLDGLLRMDPLGMAEANAKRIGAGELAPNEARLKSNLPPVEGGATPYLQQQNYSLGALARRDAMPDPFGKGATPAPDAQAQRAVDREHFARDAALALRRREAPCLI